MVKAITLLIPALYSLPWHFAGEEDYFLTLLLSEAKSCAREANWLPMTQGEERPLCRELGVSFEASGDDRGQVLTVYKPWVPKFPFYFRQ